MNSGTRRLPVRRNQDSAEESTSAPRPRILVDVSVIIQHDAQTGIQRVVRALWSGLLERSGTTFQLVPVFATRTHGYRVAGTDFLDRLPVQRPLGGPVTVRPGDKFLGLDLCAHLLPTYQRQISEWRAAGATVHLIVYDLLPIHGPQWFKRQTVRNFARWIEVVRNHCDQALCISDHVADELRAFLGSGQRQPAIARIQLAGDIEGSRPSRGIDASASTILDRMSQSPSILMVGTVEPRKGYDVALAAFEHLWRTQGEEAPLLIIVGKPGWRTAALQRLIRNHEQYGNRLFWMSNLSDESLGQFYTACSAVFLASHAEGFGLPPIEAAMHQRHALVRDLPVFREQELPNLSYFSDDRPHALADSLRELLRRSSKPMPVGDLPTWSDCATQLLDKLGLNDEMASTSLGSPLPLQGQGIRL